MRRGSGEERSEPLDEDTLVIYSSLPHSGGSAAVGDAVAAGQRLALADSRNRVGRYTIKLVELDSAEPDERDWDPDRVAENAGDADDDPATIAYLGELELGASAVSLPVTNEESILQVSPTDGLTSLTLPQAGPGEGPERFYPTESPNFLRLVPPDSAQAGPLATLASRAGATRVALAHDGGIFGRQLAGAVEQAAVDRGLEVTTVERVEPDLDEAPSLADDLAEDAPDAVIYLGIGGDPAATVLAAMADARARLGSAAGGKPARAGGSRARGRADASGQRRVADASRRGSTPPRAGGYSSGSRTTRMLRRRSRRSTATSRCASCSKGCAPPGGRRPIARR